MEAKTLWGGTNKCAYFTFVIFLRPSSHVTIKWCYNKNEYYNLFTFISIAKKPIGNISFFLSQPYPKLSFQKIELQWYESDFFLNLITYFSWSHLESWFLSQIKKTTKFLNTLLFLYVLYNIRDSTYTSAR